MSDIIQVGDRVRWRSTHPNKKGLRNRIGTVMRFYDEKPPYAYVKPDKGNGLPQFIGLLRLTKVEAQP